MAKEFPCLVVYGPRQVGKSTMVNHLFGKDMASVTLDDIDDRTLALSNPKAFLDQYPCPVCIDEIQKAPLLLDEIKKRIDIQKIKWLQNNEPYQLMYVLTGSNQFELQKGVSESLAGRAGILEMNSLSRAEIQHEDSPFFLPDIEDLKERKAPIPLTRPEVFRLIFQGGMPDYVTGKSSRENFFKAYLNTYIEKDVRKVLSVGNETAFRQFLTYAALRTGQELHYSDISNALGIDSKTVKAWFSILESSGLILLLQPYFANLSSRLVKAPKLYFMDTGLCAYLCGWQDANMLEKGVMGGAFFETYVISEIVKNYQNHGREYKYSFYYYRDTDQREVDLLYLNQGSLTPIEIKKGINPSNPSKNFSALEKYKMPIRPGLVIDCYDKIRPIGDYAYSVPIGYIG